MSSFNYQEHVALLGGSFDPPHIGHFLGAKNLIGRFGFKKLIVVPNGNHPFKNSQQTSENHRLAMARLNFANLERTEVSDVEVQGSPEPHTAFSTLSHFKQKVGIQKIAFILGEELLKELPRWSHFPQLLDLADWIVLQRKEHSANPSAVLNERVLNSPLNEWVSESQDEGASAECLLRNGRQMSIVPADSPATS